MMTDNNFASTVVIFEWSSSLIPVQDQLLLLIKDLQLCACSFFCIATIMGPKDMYLIVYNLCCCVGWSTIFALSILSLSKGIPEDGLKEALANVYTTENLGAILYFTQFAAVLEIVHASVGLVRSPVIVTSMQVASRIWALLAVTYAPTAQSECRQDSFCDSSVGIVVSHLVLECLVASKHNGVPVS
jgi:hypothetical protein